MHFEFLIEDRSTDVALKIILPKILGSEKSRHSWRFHHFKGLGSIPDDLQHRPDRNRRQLLHRLPTYLRGYGRNLDQGTTSVVVVVDLDDRDCIAFKQELLAVWGACNPRPRALFRIAIEESEAWLLGDREAVMAAYPRARRAVLERYRQDSICGTWEMLADAVHPGGAKRLKKSGNPGAAKAEWATRIAPHMEVDRNRSPSFRVFCEGLRRLASGG